MQAFHKSRNYVPEDDSSIMLREEIVSSLPRPGSDLSHPAQPAQQFETLLFYDEPLDEDAFDFELIDELFLNPQRKPVKISKDRGTAHISPIGSEEGDSDSSI